MQHIHSLLVAEGLAGVSERLRLRIAYLEFASSAELFTSRSGQFFQVSDSPVKYSAAISKAVKHYAAVSKSSQILSSYFMKLFSFNLSM